MKFKFFTLSLLHICCLASFAQRTTVTLTAKSLSVSSYTDKEIIINGATDLHLTATSKTLNNSIVYLNSDNSWLFFDNIRPQYVIDSLLRYVNVNGAPAVLKTNVRVSIYKQGAVVIPQPSTYQPLKVYTGQNFAGDSAAYSMFTYYTSLGTLDNKIRSFKLKRGYMATLATSSDGTGYSRVFIADDSDLEFSVMPDLLDNKVSFIRVFDWEYVTKKGWCGTAASAMKLLNTTWNYDWSGYAATTSYAEYVPMHAKLNWAPFSQINSLTNVTHSLGINEPEHPEQHKDDNGGVALTVSQALAQWPDMLKSGLRVGAPACTDFSWLYAFMDSCKARNYRVDYVAVHAYWGNTSPSSWLANLRYIYQRTGRPIWITEWNNGANWTTETNWPTSDRSLSASNAAKQLSDLKGILNVLDTATFIERYSIYNWVQDCRAIILADTLTPAGKYYAADNSVMAFKRKYEVIPTFTFKTPSLGASLTNTKITLSITDPNLEYFGGYVLEKKVDNGSYSEFANSDVATLKTCVDTLDFTQGTKIRYRVKSKLPGNTLSSYSNELGWDITGGSDTVQVGNLAFSNLGWNAVLFKKGWATIPSIILGAPTNNNSSTLISPRIKLVSSASRFNLQMAAWNYQTSPVFSKEENVPYLILNSGKTYNFGGLKAQTGKVTVGSSWTTVTFATPFDTIPVVFANQLLSSTSFATNVRIKNVTKTGFQARIMKETGVSTAVSSESVSYVAILPGTGVINNKKVIVGKTADKAVGTTYSTIYYGDSIPAPIFISQMQTCNDDSTATLRMYSPTAKYANVFKQKEKSTSSAITANVYEQVGWMVVNSADILQSVQNPTIDHISVYPNPVKDVVYINRTSTEPIDVEVYNIYGIMVKHLTIYENQLYVGELNSGCYFLKTHENGSVKFVKQ